MVGSLPFQGEHGAEQSLVGWSVADLRPEANCRPDHESSAEQWLGLPGASAAPALGAGGS